MYIYTEVCKVYVSLWKETILQLCSTFIFTEIFHRFSVPLLEPVDTAQEQTSSQNMDLTDNDELTGEKIFQFIFFSSIWAGRIPKSSNLIGWSRARDRSSFLRYGLRAGFFPRCTWISLPKVSSNRQSFACFTLQSTKSQRRFIAVQGKSL